MTRIQKFFLIVALGSLPFSIWTLVEGKSVGSNFKLFADRAVQSDIKAVTVDIPQEQLQTWYYRITIAVKTPEGIKIGSNIRKVTSHGQVTGGGGPAMRIDCMAEAVPVDLRKRGMLFGLVYGSGCGDVILRVFKEKNRRGGGLDPSSVPGPGGKRQLDHEEIRWVVGFAGYSDIGDPSKGRFLSEEGFKEVFGAGVSLESVIIEITNPSSTSGELEKLLPWLNLPELSDRHPKRGGIFLPTVPPELYPTSTMQLRRKYFIRSE